MSIPTDRVYSESHEWHKADGNTVAIGLTRFAVDQLTDVTFVEMKPAGSKIKAGDVIGEVESVKTTSDIYSAVSGEIVEVNEAVADKPETLNEDPYEAGWLVKIRVENTGELDGLMDADTYKSKHDEG